MKTKRNFTIVLTAVLAIAAIGTAAWAAPAPSSKESGLIGTWFGGAGSNIVWLAVHTAGSNLTSGEMLMNWVFVAPGLLHVGTQFPNVTRLTPGHGVWVQIGKGQYNYTWYAYGINDTSGDAEYMVRVSGQAKNEDSDNVSISYTYEVFQNALPQDLSGATLKYTTSGDAAETRVPLVTP